jgi:hypothetical protein
MRASFMHSSPILLAAILLPFAAQAGCVTGAVVGGVVGHVAGGHGLLGAGAGCVIAHEHDKHEAERAQQAAHSNSGQPTQAPAQGND